MMTECVRNRSDLGNSKGSALKAINPTQALGMRQLSRRPYPGSGGWNRPLQLAVAIILSGTCFPALSNADPPVAALPAVAADTEHTQAAATATSPWRVRVGIYDDSEGIAKGVKALRQFLVGEAGFVCRRLTLSEIQSGALSEVAVLIMPGGSGSAQAKNFGKQGREAVRQFVPDGGGYVGICAGADRASSHYTWKLPLINAQMVDREHWARGTGTANLRMSESGKQSLNEPADEVEVYWAAGQGAVMAEGSDATQ